MEIKRDLSCSGATRKQLPGAAFWVLFGALLLVYGRYFIGYAPSGRDLVTSYLPYQSLAKDAVWHGHLPLWNPMTFCGRPLMEDIQIGFFYPPNWLHWILPLPLSFTILFLAHAAWSLWGCLRLGRTWGLSDAASCLMAILYTFAGFFTVKALSGVILFHYAGSWLPWSALAVTALVRDPSARRAAFLSICLSLSLLAGAPQIAFYSWLIVGSLAVALVLFNRKNATSGLAIQRLGWIALAFLLAFALTAIQTWPTYELSKLSFDRGGQTTPEASWDFATEGSLNWKLLALFLNKNAFGPGHDDTRYTGTAMGFSEACAYLPVWAWILFIPAGIFALSRRRAAGTNEHESGPFEPLREQRIIFIAALVLAACSILMAGGKYSPLFRFFHDYVPGFNLFRVPARWLFGATAGIATASAIGFDRLLRSPRVANAPRPVASCIRYGIPLAAALDLALLAWPNAASVRMNKFHSTFYSKTPLIEKIKAASPSGRVLWMDDLLDWHLDQNTPEVTANALIMQGLPDARGYDPLIARWIGEWTNRLAGLPPEMNPRGYLRVPRIAIPAWLTLMGVEIVLSYEDLSVVSGMQLAGYVQFPEGPLAIWRNTRYLGIAFVAPFDELKRRPVENDPSRAMELSARLARTSPENPLDAIVCDGNILRSEMAMSGALSRLPAAADSSEAEFKVTPREQGPNRFVFETRFPKPAALYFAQSAYPGWSVKVGGEYAPLSIVCGAFMAVAVCEGTNVVEFEYRPSIRFEFAKWISLAALCGLATLALRRKT